VWLPSRECSRRLLADVTAPDGLEPAKSEQDTTSKHKPTTAHDERTAKPIVFIAKGTKRAGTRTSSASRTRVSRSKLE
jgi:hypothetical protein